MLAPDDDSGVLRAEQDARPPGGPAGRRGTRPSAGGEPWQPPGRQLDIDTRLDAIRARLKQLEDRHLDADGNRPAAPGERVEAARRRAARAHAAAALVLATNAEAFRKVAEAHDRVARMHDKTAAARIGDVIGHERQATLHRAAAIADWQRAERTRSLLSETERAWPAAVRDDPPDGMAP